MLRQRKKLNLNKNYKKIKNILRSCLFVLCLCIFCISAKELYGIYQEYTSGTRTYEALYEAALVEEKVETADSVFGGWETEKVLESIIEEASESTTQGPPITVNFEQVWETCPDVIAWLYSPDTRINYPIVQGEDNSYYLSHLADQTENSSGSLMLDCRNADDFSDWNSIIHGHSMKNGSMFRSLLQYKKQQYYEEHPMMWLLTPDQSYQLVLIAGYVTSAEDTVYTMPEDTEREAFLQRALQQSTFQTDIEVSEGEIFVTLSTCSYENDDARYILIGVLR